MQWSATTAGSPSFFDEFIFFITNLLRAYNDMEASCTEAMLLLLRLLLADAPSLPACSPAKH
jgi:hypothetical protein